MKVCFLKKVGLRRGRTMFFGMKSVSVGALNMRPKQAVFLLKKVRLENVNRKDC